MFTSASASAYSRNEKYVVLDNYDYNYDLDNYDYNYDRYDCDSESEVIDFRSESEEWKLFEEECYLEDVREQLRKGAFTKVA